VSDRRLRILDFDLECRPIAWYGGDWVTKQPTVIAWKWVGTKGKPVCSAIGGSDRSSMVLEEEGAMLRLFVEAYDTADIVTGHYIRGFDLPVINGALMRLGMPPLGPKLAEDTKEDLVKASGLSKSMENLSAMFDARTKKYQMDTAKWAAANMLLPEGIALAKKRCSTDVIEHIELRALLIENNLLNPPKLWSPSAGAASKYTP